MIAGLLVLNALLLATLLGLQWRQRRYLGAMDAQLMQLAPQSIEPSEVSNGPREVLTIELLNIMQLAASHHWAAGHLGSVAPALLRKLVYDRAVGVAERMLAEHGAEAIVKVQRVA
jgi:hypothetical protein